MWFLKFKDQSVFFVKLMACHPCLVFFYFGLFYAILSFHKKSKLSGVLLGLNHYKKVWGSNWKNVKFCITFILICERTKNRSLWKTHAF